MKTIYFILVLFVLSLSVSCSWALSPNFIRANLGNISQKDKAALKNAISSKDPEAARKILITRPSSSREYREIKAISEALFAYDICKNIVTRDKPEQLSICLTSEVKTFNAIPREIILGQPIVDSLKIFLSGIKKEISDSRIALTNKIEIETIARENRINEARARRIERSDVQKEKAEERIAMNAARQKKREERLQQNEIEEKARKLASKERQQQEHREAIEKADRIKSKCLNSTEESKSDQDYWLNVKDGRELNIPGISYGFQKLKNHPLWWECPFPKVIDAEKIPTIYRGKPVRATGRVIQILSENQGAFSSKNFVTYGLIENRRGDITYFFSPGKTPGINKRSRVVLEGYFIQNYEFKTRKGSFLSAPVVVGEMRRY